MISPLAKKRFRAFKRIKRAWYSLFALIGIYIFCQLAPLVCPYTPNDIADPSRLAPIETVERSYDIKTARFNIASDGSVYAFEGPEEVLAEVSSGGAAALEKLKSRYNVSTKERDGYVRCFLEPLEPPACKETVVSSDPSFPYPPCSGHILGLDSGGKDVYTLIVYGMRIALNFGLLLALSGMFLGLVFGAVEGYFGGKTDIICQRFTEIWSAIPFLYVMIFIGSTVGRSFGVLLVCYMIFNWIVVSYYVRAEFLRLRSRTFVEAAKCQGFSAAKIIFGHILPNALTPLVTLFPFLLMGAIGSLAALDFLGFGLPPMTPSCGELLHQAQGNPSAWWLILFPALALFIVMLLTVLVGEGLRDAFDPRQKSKLE